MDGLKGLNGGALRFDAGYTIGSLGSFRGGISDMPPSRRNLTFQDLSK
jgi:hypothetical protein